MINNNGLLQRQKAPRVRFGEPLKFLPVLFCVGTIAILYCIYVVLHCIPELQIGELARHVDEDERWRGQVELTILNVSTFLLIICYIRAIMTSAGEIPDDDSRWLKLSKDNPSAAIAQLHAVDKSVVEKKRTGDRRHCKWCNKYKPDRCHHCRVCRSCVLKMDHHCPWIYNCVGFGNYKYFFLLLLYSMIDLHLILFTMAEDVKGSVEVGAPFLEMFLIVFGMTIAFFLGTLVTLFFCFHVWLMNKGMSTIEFCEKSLPRKDDICDATAFGSSVYDLGLIRNVCAVLGNNPLLWLLPVSPPSGDGLVYEMDESKVYEEQYDEDPESSPGFQGRRNSDPYIQKQGYGYDQQPEGRYVENQ